MNHPNHFVTIVTISIVTVVLLNACHNGNRKDTSKELNDYKEIKATKVSFNFNQSFVIKEIMSGESMSDIYVSGTGFPNSNYTVTFSKATPLETFFVADLDENGFEELYLITRSVGTGSKASVFGIASMDGKSYKAIFNPENEDAFKEKCVYLKGYQGHDSIFVTKNKLYRQFPVYVDDLNSITYKPEGNRMVIYKLVLFNNAYSLQVDTTMSS